MPLRHKNFSASIETDVDTLEMYDVEEDDDGTEVVCWIESKVGQVGTMQNGSSRLRILSRQSLDRNSR